MFGVMWGLNARSDVMLLGRTTYLSFADAFADLPADNPVAAQMNRPTKVVVSATLTSLTWANSELLTGDVVAGVTALKQQPGQDILVTGSTRLVRALLAADLVDELSLLVHPIVVGKGERLFAGDADELRLQLTGSAVFSTGVVHLHYTKP
jgi:dihydrofolate reductase